MMFMNEVALGLIYLEIEHDHFEPIMYLLYCDVMIYCQRKTINIVFIKINVFKNLYHIKGHMKYNHISHT